MLGGGLLGPAGGLVGAAPHPAQADDRAERGQRRHQREPPPLRAAVLAFEPLAEQPFREPVHDDRVPRNLVSTTISPSPTRIATNPSISGPTRFRLAPPVSTGSRRYRT